VSAVTISRSAAGNGWAPFYINGVNLGAALPGRFPSEFPDRGTYVTWVRDMVEMGANTVRTYTLHPPAFYDALASWNADNPQRPLRLLQGVWAELPPGDNYYDAEWQGEFFRDMEMIVDVLHGRADVPQRPGRAAGYYTADVSQWTVGIILGREWEPYSVAEFNEKFPEQTAWQGRYFGISEATAMDVWLTRAMDHIVAYETMKYRAQRPVAYTNWPTLDPMLHPTELDAHTELRMRGIPFDETRRAHNEDEVSLNGAAVRASDAFAAGYFAAYHVYPYYPDYFLHDPEYNAAVGPWGPSTYYGYLRALKEHYAGIPLVIAEFGLPVSWGISHFNPQGFHHGGHTEQEMADINVRLAREIAASGMAGGVLFAWIDEWFKNHWLTEPFEQPGGRARMWWNRMNPEQNYGVLAVEPRMRLGATLEDRAAAWDTVAPLYTSRDGSTFRAHADEAFLWLRVSGPAARAPRLMVGFDIADPKGGGFRWSASGGPAIPVGIEFLLEIDDVGVRILATPDANPFRLQQLPRGVAKADQVTEIANRPPGFFAGSWTQVLGEPFTTPRRDDGRFVPLLAAVNRARMGADSINYHGMGYDRGILRQGALPDGAWERTAAGDIEVRIPWNLLNVSDPSSRIVIHDEAGAAEDGVAGTRQVDGINIVAAARMAGGGWQSWPASGARGDVAMFSWEMWDAPEFRVRRRPVFDAMRVAFRELERVRVVAAQQ
jgi:hypothetical protein